MIAPGGEDVAAGITRLSPMSDTVKLWATSPAGIEETVVPFTSSLPPVAPETLS